MSEQKKTDRQGQTAVKERPKTAKPPMYKVIFHNDHYTTMEFVVEVLSRFFNKDRGEALHIMLAVHHKGRAVVGTYSRDIAETKAAQTIDYAREHGHPLMVTTEPE
jgi:ATP-dependent Clp protease adaptor protein ClpS